MPIINTNFIAGRMNKSVDERLLPPGEYVDAINVRLGSTENTEIGAVENSKGNNSLTTLEYGGQSLSSSATCLGAYDDGQLETMYWFVHDPANAVATDGVVDIIVSFNTQNNQLRYHVITLDVLKFDPEYLITGVDKIEDLLFFTDGKNPPRRINVNDTYEFPTGDVDGIEEEDISVILKPPGFEDQTATGEVPLTAPTFELINVVGGENYLEDRFISFAYRYRYINNEYSATSLFSLPAFQPSNFSFDTRSYDNAGMSNAFNGAKVKFSTGSDRVVQVDLLYKDSNTNRIYVIERFKKEDYGWADNATQEYVFTNSKIYSVIGSDELLRLYDNVPLKAQAQTIMGNRLIYGNYTDGYDIVNINGQNIPIDYSTSLFTTSLSLISLDNAVLSQGVAYTINPSATTNVPNSLATVDLAEVEDQLLRGAQLVFDIRIEHFDINGTVGTACYNANDEFQNSPLNINVTINLTQDYANVFDFVGSTDFENAIGTVLNDPANSQNGNFELISSADQGISLTDRFNAGLVVPNLAAPLETCNFTKIISSITSSSEQQGFAITSTSGQTTFSLQTLAMKYSAATTPSTDIYEYFSFSSFKVGFTNNINKSSLHSDRDFETGIVYLDEYGRSSTVLVSEYNTIFVPPVASLTKNQIQATVQNYAPTWATKYKFVVKPSKVGYETVYSNFFYTNPFDNVTHFKLEGDNTNKVKVGDRLRVKRDTRGALTSLVETTVLGVEAQSSDFLNGQQELGANSEQLAGLYMQIKATNFSAQVSSNSIIDYGLRARSSTLENPEYRLQGAVSYPCYTYDTVGGTTSNYDLPAGSIVDMKFRFKREDGLGTDEKEWLLDRSFVVSEDYVDFHDFWDSSNIDLSATYYTGTGVDPQGIYTDSFVNPDPTSGDLDPNATSPTNADGTYDRAGDTVSFSQFHMYFQFIQANPGDINSPLWLGVRCGGEGTSGSFGFGQRPMTVSAEIVVQRANTVMVFETEPADANDEIYFDASEALPLVRDVATGNMLHKSTGNVDSGDQDQTTTQDAIVTLDFMDCYTFGNGVESYKYLDRIDGRSVVMGQRGLAVAEQDYKKTDRFADLTYSGVYSSSSGINNLNEFNLGLANFKTLETSFGPIQLLFARETDILTLQEDRISYVLADKNLISDSVGGGSIVSVPQILGTQIARVEEYGISYNPESFANHGPYFYFTDTKRGAVIELMGNSSNDRLRVISNLGMRSWFRDQWNFQLNTQKIGGFDPYMDEYVLGTNLNPVPVPEPVLQCGAQLSFKGLSEAVTHTYNFGSIIGNSVVDYEIYSGGITIDVLWNGNTYSSGVVTVSGSFTWDKSALTPTNAQVTITPVDTAAFSVTPQCVGKIPLTVVKCMINSSTNAGETIHVEYSWSNTNSNSPVDSDMATLGTSNNTFSFYNVQAGIRSQGVFPYSGVDFTIRTNKVNFDDYNWGYPEDNFKYLSSNTLYANTPTDVAALLAASTTIPNVDVTSPSPNINLATVTGLSLPVGNQYLYVIYDLRDIGAQQLCYDSASALAACCTCTWSCVSFSASTVSAEDTVCGMVINSTYYHNNGSGSLPVFGSVVYTSSNCEDTTTGLVNVLPSGFYKISLTQYMQVGLNGLVLEIKNC